MSPRTENNVRLPLDKHVLLKGGETKTPVPGEYSEMDKPRLLPLRAAPAPCMRAPPLTPLSCLKALHSLSQPTSTAGSAPWSTNAAWMFSKGDTAPLTSSVSTETRVMDEA